MLQTGVDVADNVVGTDFSLRRALHVLNRGFRDLQALKLLLSNGVGDGPHVAFDFLFAERRAGHRSSWIAFNHQHRSFERDIHLGATAGGRGVHKGGYPANVTLHIAPL